MLYRGIGLIVAFHLAGCGLARQAQEREQMRESLAKLRPAIAACDALPGLRAKVGCVNEAENQYLRPYYPYSDLLSLGQANRVALAAKVERGQIGTEDALLELAKVNSAITSEGDRRRMTGRSVRAQEATAAAADRTVTCINMGSGMVTCN